MKRQLIEVKDWAQRKINSCQEPPWAWYQYMKLIEASDALLAGMGAVAQTANSQQLAPRQGNVTPLEDARGRREKYLRRPVDPPIQLPT